jgi:Site-specific recombinase XerD
MNEKNEKKRSTFSVMCFIKKTKLLKSGEAPIFIRITTSGQSTDLSIQGSILPVLWCQSKERSKGKDRAATELNHYIDSVKSRIFQIHRELEVDGKTITPFIIKDVYLGKNVEIEDEAIGKTLGEVHSEHNERCRKLLGIDYSKSTIYKFDTSLSYLKQFIRKNYGADDILLDQINGEFIRNYDLFLKTEKGCQNNSAIKHLKIFKKIIRLAIANEWMAKDPFVGIKFKLDEVHVEFLTSEELSIIMNKELSIRRLSQVRDVFLFCAFTGLAFVDVNGLKPEHIIKGNNGEIWIRKPRTKTNNMCNIPLLKIPQTILKKYEGSKESEIKGSLLPVPTNQKMNAYLKELADICEINKRLTTHVARHTFGTTVTLANKVTMENVAKMLGHSSTRMTQHYARVLDQSILEDMTSVDKAFSKFSY